MSNPLLTQQQIINETGRAWREAVRNTNFSHEMPSIQVNLETCILNINNKSVMFAHADLLYSLQDFRIHYINPLVYAVLNPKQPEAVDHPAHYGGADDPYEVIKVLERWLTPDEFRGALKFNIHKYLARALKKGGAEDERKAQWYLNYLVEWEKRLDVKHPRFFTSAKHCWKCNVLKYSTCNKEDCPL